MGSTGSCGVIWLLESCCLGCMSSVSFLWCWCRSLFGALSLRVVHGLFFLSYCGVSSGVRVGHGLLCCVRVVICFCRLCHCCLPFPCLPHLGEPFLLILGFVLSLLIVVVLSRESFDWKRVVVSSSGSSSSVAFAKVTCVLFVFSLNFLFFFLSPPCFAVQNWSCGHGIGGSWWW